MPIFNLKVLTNNGGGTYLDLDVNPSGGVVTVASNGLINIAQDTTPHTVGEGAVYDAEDKSLTLPITILGFATTANKMTADYAVGATLTLSAGSQTIYAVPATPRLSVDVSTLACWDALSAGSHDITIVAKAAGFKDSAPSAAVQVTKASAFKQVPITTSTYNNYKVSVIENMDTTKVYTVYDGGIIDGFVYSNDNWTTWGNEAYGLYIAQQTKTSVTFTMGNSYDWTGGSYVSVIEGAALEGNVQATKEDFTNIPTTKTLVYVPCFVEGTLIRMADGTDKRVENIRYGDEVQCYDFATGQKTFAPIDWMIPESVATKYWRITFSDGSTINLVGSNGKSHRIYNLMKQRFDYPQDFEPSDITVKDDGSIVTIVSCKEIEKTVKYYNVATKDHINVYANGFLTSNRLNNRYKIVDNKFTDEQVMSDEEIAAYKKHLENIRLK